MCVVFRVMFGCNLLFCFSIHVIIRFWGALVVCSLPSGVSASLVVIGSRNEDPSLVEALHATRKSVSDDIDCDDTGVVFYSGNGAGFKALCALTGRADAYLLSTPSTYQWDTCGVQAILQSIGGCMLSFKDSVQSSFSSDEKDADWSKLQVRYSSSGLADQPSPRKWCNPGGLLAVRNVTVAKQLVKCCHQYRYV